jgi:multidrug efflux pump subunit AcrB
MWPVIAAICTTMAAFIPMLLITGTSGQFMSILPKTVIACLIASLIECLFVLPAHYMDWGSKSSAKDAIAKKTQRGPISGLSYRLRESTDQLIDRARTRYLAALDVVLAHRMPFLAACVGAFYFSCGLSAHVPVDLFPSDFNQLFITVHGPVDYNIDQMNKIVRGVERGLDPLSEEILEISTYTGQAMSADERPIFGSNYGLIFVAFADTPENAADPDRLLNLIRERLAEYRVEHPTGIEQLIVLPPRNGPPIGKPVAVRIVSDDFDLAKQISGDIQAELATLPGVYNIEDNMPHGRRELRVGLDEYRASLHGLTFQDLGVALRGANDGLIPSTFKDPYSDEDVDIRVMLRESDRSSAAQLVDVELRTPEQYTVKIGDVGTVDLVRGYQRLYHYDAQRAVVVYADVDNQAATSVSANQHLEARFADIPRRYPGVSLVFGGEYQETNRAFEDMGRAFIIALIAIYAILAAQFRSYLQPLVVMCVIVFAYIGVVLGMWIWGYALSMYVIYAVVGLAGIVVNDSLVLIDFVNREVDRGTPRLQAVRIAGNRRFRAILLTTLTTVAGLLPMATGISGVSKVFGPFAAAIVAGLAVASGLTLFVVPTLYLTLMNGAERFRVWRQGGRASGTAGVLSA